MSSAAHCGRHGIYRCDSCEQHHKDSYHDSLYDLDKRIVELDCALSTKELEFKELGEHYEVINQQLIDLQEVIRHGEASDGYHTHNELYEFRKLYNAALFNEWGKSGGQHWVHKSKRHHDGEICFGGGWFIVVAVLPAGQISNHYRMEDWDLFQIQETETALFEYDGHTAADTIKRLSALLGSSK